MAATGSKLFLFVLVAILLSSQAMAGWNVFSPESPPGVAASATCLINGPCSMNTDIYMNGNTIHNVTVLGLSYSWNDIQNKPPGFADNVDNDTQYTADEIYINLVANQFILNEGKLNSSIKNHVESGNVDLNWNYLINVPPNLDVDRTDDVIDTTNHGGDVVGTYDDLQLISNVIGDNEINYSDVTVSDFTNDANYVAVGDDVSDLVNDANYVAVGDNVSDLVNDAGYLTNATLNGSLNGSVDQFITDIWVNETGDTMTGDLHMSNNSIYNVHELNVHNITGNSPVNVNDELIVQNSIVAKGNITLDNPNSSYFIGERFLGNSFTFINPNTNETLMKVSDTSYPLFGDDLGDVKARTMTIDRLIITGLLNYSNTEPPDYYFSDEHWIYKTNTNGTTFTFNFNGTLLNSTIAQTINNASINWTNVVNLPPGIDLNSSDDVTIYTVFGGDVNGTYDDLQILADVIGDNEINYSQVTVGDFFNDAQYINFYIFNSTTTALNQSIIDLAIQHNLDMIATNNTIDNLNTSLTTYIMNVDNATNVRIDNLNLTFSQDISDLYTYIGNFNTSLQADHTALWNAIAALNLSHINDVNNIFNTITNLNISLSQDITDVSTDLHTNYYNKTTSDDRFVNVAGDTMTGSLVINGNLTIIGDYVNATVETQYLDGDFIPSLDGMFDIGANTAYWDTVYAENLIGLLDWSNLTNVPDFVLKTEHDGDILALNTSINNLDNQVNTRIDNLNTSVTNQFNQVNNNIDALNISFTTDINNLTNYVNTQNHSGDVVGPYNDLQIQTDVVGDNEINYSESTLADFTNDDGYVKDGDGKYIYKDTPLSDVVRFNETKLNQTVYLLTGIFEETINITVVGGVGTGVTSECCTGAAEILDVRVTPTSPGTKYKFSANSTVAGEVVDTDRSKHTGVWWVAHRGTVVTDENINYYITNSDTDEVFSVRVRYQR